VLRPLDDQNGEQAGSCALQHAVGRYERCPQDRCPFWHSSACAIGSLRADIETTPGLAALLLDFRSRLAGDEGWSPFRLVRGRD
jgi:hypothetical protein